MTKTWGDTSLKLAEKWFVGGACIVHEAFAIDVLELPKTSAWIVAHPESNIC
jgi:quinolinate synthase